MGWYQLKWCKPIKNLVRFAKYFFLCFVRSFETRHAYRKFILPPNGLGNIHFRKLLCWYIRPDEAGTPFSRVAQILSTFCLSYQSYCLGSVISGVQLMLTCACCHSCDHWQLWVHMSHYPVVLKNSVPVSHSLSLALTVFTTPLQQLFLSLGRRNCDSDVHLKSSPNTSSWRRGSHEVPSDKLLSIDSCWEKNSHLPLRVHWLSSSRRSHIHEQGRTHSWVLGKRGGSGQC